MKISKLSDLGALFSQKGIAILAFLMIFFVFILNTSLCPESKMKKNAALIEEKLIPGEEEYVDPNEGIVMKMCRMKNHLTTNVAVAFLVLTVIRQVMIRVQSSRDRVR